MSQNKFTEDEQAFIRNNVKGKTVSELTNLFNLAFNKNISENTIKNYKKKNKLRSEINTKFKKGQVPHNYKPVGSEFICDGYIYIKTEEPNKWVLKQRFLYESMYGDIPTGYSVIFADKDKNNFNPGNLILVRNKDKLVAKNKHLIFENSELTKSGILLAKLINSISERNKE